MSTVDPAQPVEAPFQSTIPLVEFWDDTEWKTFDDGEMWVDRLSLRTMNAGISQALLKYETGTLSFSNETPQEVAPLDLDRKWVRITATDDTTPTANQVIWVGLVIATEEQNRAAGDGNSTLMTQLFTAVGAEWLLSRTQVVRAITASKSLDYGLSFNAREDSRLGRQVIKGNKDTNSEQFADSDDTAERWTGEDIVRYIKEYGFVAIEKPFSEWIIEGVEVIEWVEPVISVHGRTLFDILTALANPSRGCTATVEYVAPDDPEDTAEFGSLRLRIDSGFQNEINLPSGKSIPGARDVVALSTVSDISAMTNITQRSSQKFEQVIVQGARAGAVATYSLADGSLEPDWRQEDEDDYRTGIPTPTSTEPSTIKSEHDRYRRQKLPEVFGRFVVPLNWNGELVNQAGRVVDYSDGDLYINGMTFANYVPLIINVDYLSDRPEPTPRTFETLEFRRPFVAFETNEGWFLGEEPGTTMDELQGQNGYDFFVRVRPLDRRLGIQVTPSTANHAIASAVLMPVDPNTSDIQAQIDYNKLIFTGYVQLHSMAEGRWPPDQELPDRVGLNGTIILRVGDTAFLDIMPAGTVVDVVGGQLQFSQTTMYVRDDREYLEDVARMAFEWYGRNRYSSQIVYDAIALGALPGAFVSSIDGIPANATVTTVDINYVDQTTQILTDFAEPDFRELGAR